MPLSRTQVINDGLRHISANLIADPDEDTESARQAKGVYEQVVRSELEAYAWFFAKAQASLPQNAEQPLFRFARAFNLPSNFIRLVELEQRWVFNVIRYIDVDPIPPYEIQGRAILTDLAAPLKISYLKDVTNDPTTWTPLFANVVSAALAIRLAMPLTKSEGMVTLATNIYKNELFRAKKANAIQMPPQQIPDGSWIMARFY
jgi:hypothetical protein